MGNSKRLSQARLGLGSQGGVERLHAGQLPVDHGAGEYGEGHPVSFEQKSDVVNKTLISDCGKYCYEFSRHLEITPPLPKEHAVMFVMNNPLMTDANPTVWRCIEFARAWGFNRIMIGHLFAFRADETRKLRQAYHEGFNIIGPENGYHLRQMAKDANMIVCAWGPNAELSGFTERTLRVCEMLRYFGDLYLISRTRHGGPAHPLYLHSRLRPQVYMERRDDAQK